MLGKIEIKSFTLTMLGTDTNFTPILKAAKKIPQSPVADYPKGELLSVISSLIYTNGAPERTASVPYKSDEVSVVNGPVTIGSNVGDKIGTGLGELLLAIARGQQLINIIAHSRGAVESVLIAHELQAVQEMINGCDSIEAVIVELKKQQTQRHKNRESINNTPDIITHLQLQLAVISAEERANWFDKLKNNLADTSVNFFGIDPVPGDVYPITWYDERYFILPTIIKNAQIFYYENEYSNRGFTPAYIEESDNSKQNVCRYTIPGHHGTGSAGNNASQQRIVVAPERTKTTHVQKLLLYKILGFLSQHGVHFNDPRQSMFKLYAGLGRKYASMCPNVAVEEDRIDVAALDFPTIYRKIYEEIAKNREGYRAYNRTSYTLMGVVKQRRLLHKGHAYGLLSDMFTIQSGLINDEHGVLVQEYFYAMFQNNNHPHDLASFVMQTRGILENNIRTLAQPEVSADLGSSFVLLDNKKDSTLHDKDTRVVVAKNFAMVIQSISAAYLNDDWHTAKKQQDKAQLFAAIKELFTSFKALAKLEDDIAQEFVAELAQLSIEGIDSTIEQQYETLNKNFNGLAESRDLKLQQFFQSLVATHIDEPGERNLAVAKVDQIMRASGYQALAEHPPEQKIGYIIIQLEHVDGLALVNKIIERFKLNQQKIEDAELSPDKPDVVNDETLKGKMITELTRNFMEQYESDLSNFASLYEQMYVLMNDLAALSHLIPEKEQRFSRCVASLRINSVSLVEMAAKKFYYGRGIDELPPIADAGTFVELAERYAITHYNGMIDRAKEQQIALEHERHNLQHAHEEAQHVIAQLQQDNDEALRVNTLLQQRQEELEHQLAIEEKTKAQFEVALNNEQESEYLLLIRDKLRPLTERYLNRLESSSTNGEQRNNKIAHVARLLACLNDSKIKPLASERVYAFYESLNQASKELHAHRDPSWKLFVRNALIMGGILISGILPGLLVLTLYTQITGNSFTFWSSHGANFVKSVRPITQSKPRLATPEEHEDTDVDHDDKTILRPE